MEIKTAKPKTGFMLLVNYGIVVYVKQLMRVFRYG